MDRRRFADPLQAPSDQQRSAPGHARRGADARQEPDHGQRKTGRPSRTPLWGLLLVMPALVPIGLYFVWPLLWAGRISLFDYSGYGPLEDYLGLENYTRALADADLWIALGRNLFVTAVNLLGAIGVGSILAYALYKKVAGWRFLQIALFIPYILPVAVIALLWRFIYEPNQGLLNSLLRSVGVTDSTILWLGDATLALPAVAIVWAWQLVPFGMVVLFAAMLRIPDDLVAAARVDGARESQLLRYVVLPAIRPTVWLLAILVTMISFRTFDMIWIMTQGGPADATTTGTLYLYQQAFQYNNYGYAAALGFVIAALLGGILPLALRRMDRSTIEL